MEKPRQKSDWAMWVLKILSLVLSLVGGLVLGGLLVSTQTSVDHETVEQREQYVEAYEGRLDLCVQDLVDCEQSRSEAYSGGLNEGLLRGANEEYMRWYVMSCGGLFNGHDLAYQCWSRTPIVDEAADQ